MRIGILALQGNYMQHAQLLESLSYAELSTVLIRTKEDLSQLDGIILPGGESTTMLKLLVTQDMYQELSAMLRRGIPTLATCAGVIFLAKRVFADEKDTARACFSGMGVADVDVCKNAYGRQIRSFIAQVDFHAHSTCAPYRSTIEGMFIRAPKIVKIGKGVEVLAYYKEDPAIIQEKNILMSIFHPEALMQKELHNYFLHSIVVKRVVNA